MTDRRQRLLQLLGGRQDLLDQLRAAGLVPEDEAKVTATHTETARVVYTLTEELDVNWAGVEVILRLRTQLIETRRQVADLVELLRTQPRERNDV